MLHTENQLIRFPGSSLKVSVGGVGFLPIIKSLPPQVEAELGCDKKANGTNKEWI